VTPIIASQLEVASILSQAKSEHLPFRQILIVEGLKNGFLEARGLFILEAKDAISFLGKEVLSLLEDTAKG